MLFFALNYHRLIIEHSYIKLFLTSFLYIPLHPAPTFIYGLLYFHNALSYMICGKCGKCDNHNSNPHFTVALIHSTKRSSAIGSNTTDNRK